MIVHSERKQFWSMEEWIDGATFQRADGDGASTGFAWTFYERILKLMSMIVTLAPHESKFKSGQISKDDLRSLKNYLGNLYIWGDGFRDGTLETLLGESDDLKESIITTLIEIGWTLISSQSSNLMLSAQTNQ